MDALIPSRTCATVKAAGTNAKCNHACKVVSSELARLMIAVVVVTMMCLPAEAAVKSSTTWGAFSGQTVSAAGGGTSTRLAPRGLLFWDLDGKITGPFPQPLVGSVNGPQGKLGNSANSVGPLTFIGPAPQPSATYSGTMSGVANLFTQTYTTTHTGTWTSPAGAGPISARFRFLDPVGWTVNNESGPDVVTSLDWTPTIEPSSLADGSTILWTGRGFGSAVDDLSTFWDPANADTNDIWSVEVANNDGVVDATVNFINFSALGPGFAVSVLGGATPASVEALIEANFTPGADMTVGLAGSLPLFTFLVDVAAVPDGTDFSLGEMTMMDGVAVPEPTALMMSLFALVGILSFPRRRR